jgi:hypothetical protein
MPEAAQRTAAFSNVGEAVFAAAMSGRVVSGEVAAVLLGAMARRMGLKRWVWAFGLNPDELNRRDEVSEWLLQAPNQGGDDTPWITWLADGARSEPKAQLALEFGTEGTQQRFQRFCNVELPFWIGDRDMGVRLSYRAGQLSFRAHHPVIHKAIEDRCDKEGFFLL